MAEQYTKARFWKCALQVNPAGYIKYRGQEQSSTEADYNQTLLKVCLEENIKVVGIADHGDVTGVDAIRDLMAQHDIVVFPGFEIASSEKVHFVCLFAESTSSQQLERYLGNLKLLNTEDGIRPSRLSAEQLIDEVDQLGGFIYSAHCTNDNGLLKRRLDHVWKNTKLRAAQISNGIEDLRGIEDDFYRKVLLNKNTQYQRKRPIAVINAKDVEAPETLKEPGASCLIKMTTPCFESFKLAFLDPESRVRLNSDVPKNHSSAIEAVEFTGGYLDGVKIEFSDHLNAVIGGRGTGKSTLLECIRFALSIRPLGQSAQRQHDQIIKENLGREKGQIKLKVRSSAMHGRTFQISRRFGDQPIVKDESGALSPYTPCDLLPRLEIFGQNEIYELSQDSSRLHLLLGRFLEGGQTSYESQSQEILTKLKENRQAIIRAYQQLGDVESEVSQLPKLQDQVSQFQSLGLDEKLKAIPKLETEKRLSARIAEELTQLQQAIESTYDTLPDTIFLSDQALKELPHAALLVEQRKLLDEVGAQVKDLLNQANQKVVTTQQALQPLQHQLTGHITSSEEDLEKDFKEIPASQGKSGREIGAQYQSLLREIERIKPMKMTLTQRQALITELENKRKSLLADLGEARTHRSTTLHRALKKLNKKLKGKLKLTIVTEGDRDPLFQFFSSCALEGVGPKRLAGIRDECSESPASLAELIRSGSGELKISLSGIVTPSVAEALTKLPRSKLLELEELDLPDSIQLELNVGHTEDEENYRPLERLSTGQQCTAILHLLLLENQDPLILDQPEDNLDNAFIADRIVTELRSAKVARQFLFATHNANIPVFGDAEWIGVLNVSEGKGEIPSNQQGAIDLPEVKRLAAEILEGGESAFNQRREKYGFE
ncbi:TrlF family AAA-like ATPase [Franzmannia qiaohouensis]|uniref:AAA family ATPase n=1 Tax=Franzmannia qiaohouensis TaxID=1329370 RepID=A0ABU1HJP4_9GAMM|nr:AAA family ATPase [Halomonas qiaohouensis]MDR5907511.1 AAA family ATPase [Halomonas qiaohouensis]